LREKPDEWWSLDTLAAGARIPEPVAADALQDLVRSNLVEVDPASRPSRFRYRPADAASRSAVDALASIYQGNPIQILRVMSAHAIERVRNSAIRTFANAFVWKKGEDDHD
jgi:hypothetical protein